MTEAEWLVSKHPAQMMAFLTGYGQGNVFVETGSRRLRNRKLRLFACGCVRLIWHLLTDERSRDAVEALEEEVDSKYDPGSALDGRIVRALEVSLEYARNYGGEADTHPLIRAKWSASDAVGYIVDSPGAIPGDLPAFFCAIRTADALGIGEIAGGLEPRGTSQFVAILHDIVGNPWRPIRWDGPAAFRLICQEPYADCRYPWLVLRREHISQVVLSIASAAYDGRDWDALPILADALEDAGCDNRDILDHLRGPGPHVRGCWCVDLLLGKG